MMLSRECKNTSEEDTEGYAGYVMLIDTQQAGTTGGGSTDVEHPCRLYSDTSCHMPEMLLTASTVSCCKVSMPAEQILTSQAGGRLYAPLTDSSAALHCIDLLHISVTTVLYLCNV